MHAKVKPQTNLHIYGVASCQGAQDRRCDITPDLLKGSNLTRKLEEQGVIAEWQNIFRMENHAERHDLVKMLSALSGSVAQSVTQHTRFAIVGGDHSSAIGTWSGASQALRNQGDIGLVWVDAHMDAHTPQSSLTGALHGMPVACLLGHSAPELADIAYAGQKIKPENICLVGVRSFEAPELQLLTKLGVTIHYMDDIRRKGINEVMSAAIEQVSKHTKAFGVSIDMDVFDPVDAPGVGTPSQDGLLASAFLPVCKTFGEHEKFIGAEIVEFNPYRDRNHKTELLIKDLIAAIFH